MDVDVATTVRLSILRGEQVAVGVVLRDFRCEGHHLPSGRVTAHIGIAQIDIVAVDGYDAVKVALELALLLTLCVAPLAIEYVALSHLRLHLHKFALDEVLHLLDRDDLLINAPEDTHSYGLRLLETLGLTCCDVGFENGVLNLGRGKRLLKPIPLDDLFDCCCHTSIPESNVGCSRHIHLSCDCRFSSGTPRLIPYDLCMLGSVF